MDTPDAEIHRLQHAQARVVAAARDLGAGARVAAHQHPRAQLLYCMQGLIRADTAGARWTLPSGRALWVPPGQRHAFVALAASRVRTVYVSPEAWTQHASGPRVVSVTPLLKELMLRLLDDPTEDEVGPQAPHVVALALLEFDRLRTEALALPMPLQRDLLAYARAVLSFDEGGADAAAFAARAGLSPKTFSRRFLAETGMTPGRWQVHARLLRGIELLSQGHSVTQAAMELGYQSSSAFSDLFRRTFGAVPSRYLAS